MKRFLAVTLLATVVGLSSPGVARGVDEYDQTQSHPLRVAAYLAYPIGVLVDWLVFRPFHYLVSQPELEPVFGHQPHRMGDS